MNLLLSNFLIIFDNIQLISIIVDQLTIWLSFLADWDLEIDPVSVDDDDIYQCQVTLGYTSSLRSRKAKVEVLVPPQDPFIQEGPILNVKESRDAVLTCVAKGGKPAAKVCKIQCFKNNTCKEIF